MLPLGIGSHGYAPAGAGARLASVLAIVLALLLIGLPAQSALAQGAQGSLSQLAPPDDCVQQASSSVECTTSSTGLTGTQDVVVSPGGDNVYVLSNGDNAIAEFARSQGGSLSPLSSPNSCIANQVIDVSSGTCPQQVVNGMRSPQALAISPDGQNVYVAATDNNNIGTVVELSRSSDGSLSQLSPNDCVAENPGDPNVDGQRSTCANQSGHGLEAPVAIAVSPDGRSVYVASRSGQVAEFTRNSNGSLSQLNGNDDCITDQGFPTSDCTNQVFGLGGTDGVIVSPDGNTVYTAGSSNGNNQGGVIAWFNRNPADGTLSQPGGASGCTEGTGSTEGCSNTGVGFVGQIGLAASPDGRNVYSASEQLSGPIAEFTRNGDGSLTQLPSPK